MPLFSGIARFSPSVPDSAKEVWTAQGGIAAVTHKERQVSRWLFCNGVGDPWLEKFSAQPVVVFHANWILASAVSGFPLPLANCHIINFPEFIQTRLTGTPFQFIFTFTDRFSEFNMLNIQSKRNQGSHRTGLSREVLQINPEIFLSTRLTTPQKETISGKRPREPSPEHWSDNEGRLNKKKLRSVEVFKDSASELGTSGSQKIACEQTSKSLSSHAVTPVISVHRSRGVGSEQADDTEIYRNSESIISTSTADHDDRLQTWEDKFSKGQVRKDMGFFNPIESDGIPENRCTGTSADYDIWAYLIRQSTTRASDATDCGTLPTIRVSDALVALKNLNPKAVSGNNDGVVLFVKGRVHCGRKFAVDKGDDRRKTI